MKLLSFYGIIDREENNVKEEVREMSTQEILKYRVLAQGKFVRKYNDNIKEIKYEKLQGREIYFKVTGFNQKEESIKINLM